jgi:hypothetical protein
MFDYLNLEVHKHLINLGVGSSLQDVSYIKRSYVEDFMFQLWIDHNSILQFNKFCRVGDFEFLNFVLTKNLEMDYSFF